MACNNVPNFGQEQENVERRLAIFNTKTMPQRLPEANDWMKENAMNCLIWMVNQINSNIDDIDVSERFYEKLVSVKTYLVYRLIKKT